MTPPDEHAERGPAHESELNWRRQEMVRWFAPGQLAATAVRAGLSGIFGSYADRREMQAALDHGDRASEKDPNLATWNGLFHDYSEAPADTDFWIDFVADLGDGFDSTYSIAWLIAQPSLPAPSVSSGGKSVEEASAPNAEKTTRGQILVLGGDQVYPTPLRDQYRDRFSGPYEAALPWVTDAKPPHMYAIPGNHDWYDGLTAFLRIFCQSRWIGGWRTQQHRSYFAIRLPQHWWLLGVDVQLESDLDRPQRDYFCAVGKKMERGDRVILCTPEPAWVHAATAPKAFGNLAFFEKTVVDPNGAELVLTLTGDMHHYSRYSDTSPDKLSQRHKITAGGGGAYLLGTGMLPDDVDLEISSPTARVGTSSKESTRYTREAAYPSPWKSFFLKVGALLLSMKNPSFGVFLGILYAIFAWFLQSASKLSLGLLRQTVENTPGDFMTLAKNVDVHHSGIILGAFWDAFAHSPLLAALTLFIIAALVKFSAPDVERSQLLRSSKTLQGLVGYIVGAVHGLAHIALATALIWFFAWFNLVVLAGHIDKAANWNVDHVGHVVLFFGEMALFGGTIGAVLFSLFLLPFVNYNEAFAAQHLETFKNFLRMRLGKDGTLTVYPYGVDEPGKFTFTPDAAPGMPYFAAMRSPTIRLIEEPITLAAPSK